jgi:hypothetical protein
VLANRPTAAESRQMLALGATACLSKSSAARDVLHAIHLAWRGLHGPDARRIYRKLGVKTRRELRALG